MKKNKDENMVIQFTEKGKRLCREIEKAVDEWLDASGMTRDDLKKYKNVEKFHIAEKDEGFYLAYYEKGVEKGIGCGMHKEQFHIASWIFSFVCIFLDGENNYKTTFSKTWLKWAKKHENK